MIGEFGARGQQICGEYFMVDSVYGRQEIERKFDRSEKTGESYGELKMSHSPALVCCIIHISEHGQSESG